MIGPHEPRPDLTIVVSNNGGGGIFATLEPGEPLHDRAFERVFGTPHDVQLAGVVEGAGWEHVLVTSEEHLPIKGRKASAVVPFGAGAYTLVAAPRGS